MISLEVSGVVIAFDVVSTGQWWSKGVVSRR
jgi:hypothetical protein